MVKRKAPGSTPIETVKHKDKRTNIPTRELGDFVKDDEKQPKTILYPRDPSLDPQLVWKGKDEQDSKDLAVPAVPVYIQEKIHPQVIVEDIRRFSRREKEAHANLFADFNNIKFEDLIDFYHHEQNWSNRMILGDSLLVMTSLAEKENLKGQVQMIYLDPPYGIKFGSNWQVSTRKRDVKDGKSEDLTRQPEQVRAFRDTWQLGVHSYLAYLRDRLVVSRQLLTESGSIFVQIGDENVHLVRCLMDEVFGSENFVSLINYATTSGLGKFVLDKSGDYIIWYAKRIENIKFRNLLREKQKYSFNDSAYHFVESEDGSRRSMTPDEKLGHKEITGNLRVFRYDNMVSQSGGEKGQFAINLNNKDFYIDKGSWKTGKDGIERLKHANRLSFLGNTLCYIRYLNDFPVQRFSNMWTDTTIAGFASDKIYVVQTSLKVIERCVLMTTDPGDLVLDPTCGSGTTAYVAEQWGRRYITIDTSRVALALARTRLMSAKFPYYILSDSKEGIGKEAEVIGQIPPQPLPKTEGNIKKGFVYRRVPHITLRSIANNPEIEEIYRRWQEKMEPVRGKLNKSFKQKWEEWQIPRESEKTWSAEQKQLLAEWWSMRKERQQEIDGSISRRADTELLYDQPFEDNKRARVTGPFTVESLSPHRVLALEKENALSKQDVPAGQFETMIIENLKKAGVQNTVRNERLVFTILESFAGEWIQAKGEYADRDGKTRRVAVSIGPEHGTVGPDQVKEAAKEALRGVGFDLLIVCGFAFDAHVNETAREFKSVNGALLIAETSKKTYGKLSILLARINPDLAMGDELLKKTGAGNLFMVFGEPDIRPTDPKTGKLLPNNDGKFVIEIKGLDVFDPTTGEIRSSSTDDIACWFIDTDYNEESFFVRHAYFTGADQPYEKLKRALRTEVDESAWQSLYSTVSRPFGRPKTGKVAVKVINHYGDEILKVFEV